MNDPRKEISEFVIDACLEIIAVAQKECLEREINPINISKIEAGDYVSENRIFFIKLYENHRLTESYPPIKFSKEVAHKGHLKTIQIRIKF
ncbi:MAG: hypothetical protein MCSN_3740 [Candidatus Microsyncoccus archaeolyticus]|nr:MAG: hypothetical protein MCSN_3740 [Candidatus Parcubacteria bacterium]